MPESYSRFFERLKIDKKASILFPSNIVSLYWGLYINILRVTEHIWTCLLHIIKYYFEFKTYFHVDKMQKYRLVQVQTILTANLHDQDVTNYPVGDSIVDIVSHAIHFETLMFFGHLVKG